MTAPDYPTAGERCTYDAHGLLQVPDQPIVPFIEGDGVGADIMPVVQRVVDHAVSRAYQNRRRLHWFEVFAGQKAMKRYGEQVCLPDDTVHALSEHAVGIKGPLMTPVGGGIRSLNVALRQRLDLYVCQRPVRYFPGVPSPVKRPQDVDMVVFRENAEGIYMGIEWPAGSDGAREVLNFLHGAMNVRSIRFPESSGVGIKLTSEMGSKRLIKKAIDHAIAHQRRSVTLVHKGNIMKYTEGAFRDWGYELAREAYGAQPLNDGTSAHRLTHPETGLDLVINDVIADAFFQKVLINPQDYDVVATMNLNGDYLSDALAAQVGGIGISPGANLGDRTALFEATHGTAPDIAGQDRANPCSLLLSAVMMLQHMGWLEAAEMVETAMARCIANGQITGDLASQHPDQPQPLSTSAFGEALLAELT